MDQSTTTFYCDWKSMEGC